MTVKITKPAINLREKLAELDKPSGIAGQDILKADTPQEVFNYIGAGRRNLIINGDMRVWQRTDRTTHSQSVKGFYADRWLLWEQGVPTYAFDITQSTDAPDGFSKSFKMNCTTAEPSLATNVHSYFEYNIEGQDLQHLKYGTSNAQELTLSFWVKSNVTGQYIVRLYASDGTNTRFISKSYTVDTAGTWEKKVISIEGLSEISVRDDTNTGIQMRFGIASAANYSSSQTFATNWTATNPNEAGQQVNIASAVGNYFQFTGVQLEVGSVATPFEHRSYGEELALCQRYYEVYTSRNISFAPDNVNGNARMMGTFAVNKRAQPTMTATGGWTLNGSVNAYEGYHVTAGNQQFPDFTADSEI
jgi:hypothetical protein